MSKEQITTLAAATVLLLVNIALHSLTHRDIAMLQERVARMEVWLEFTHSLSGSVAWPEPPPWIYGEDFVSPVPPDFPVPGPEVFVSPDFPEPEVPDGFAPEE